MNFPLQEEELRSFVSSLKLPSSCLFGMTAFAPQCFCLKILAQGSEILVQLQDKLKEKLRSFT